MTEWSFPVLLSFPIPLFLLMMLSLITYSPSSSLFSYSTSLLSALFCRQYLSETKILKVQIIWNWIRSCSLKEILHTYLLHFYWGILMMFGLSARHSPRGRPSNWPSMTPTPPQKGEDKGQQFMDWLIGWNQLHIQRYSLNCQECQHSDPSTYIIICIYAPTSAFLLK